MDIRSLIESAKKPLSEEEAREAIRRMRVLLEEARYEMKRLEVTEEWMNKRYTL